MPFKKRNKKIINEDPNIRVPTAIRMGIVANPTIPDPAIPVNKEVIVGSGLNAIKSLRNGNSNLPIL